MPVKGKVKVKKAVRKVGSTVKKAASKVKRAVKVGVTNRISNAVYSAKGRTKQEGGTTTTTKEYSPKYSRYQKGKASDKKITKTKTVKGNSDKGYTLTKTKTKQTATKSSRGYKDPVKTKTKTKSISRNKAAKVIKKGAKKQVKQQSTYRTLKNALGKKKK